MAETVSETVPEWQKNVPRPLPPLQPKIIVPGLTLVSPLSRRGHGPGVIVLVNEAAQGLWIDDGVPSVFMKWAEEGYCVAEVLKTAWDHEADPIAKAVKELDQMRGFDSTYGIGLVCYDPLLLGRLSSGISSSAIRGMVCYEGANASVVKTGLPTLLHVAGGHAAPVGPSSAYNYSNQKSAYFASPRMPEFDYSTEAVSHSRSLTFLKKHMGGPYFDLETIWDEHTYYEFENRSVENTMNTMVAEPYVNHIPTLTGGVGRKNLSNFYQNHFIFSNPDDAELELISRTTGIDRVVDEFIYKCTHDRMIDWLLPGVPPTNLKIEIPMMAVVNIRGDRLYHEHIHWDHATALRQVGCLPHYLELQEDKVSKGTLRLPAIGTEGAAKLRDRNAHPSNEMFKWGIVRDPSKI